MLTTGFNKRSCSSTDGGRSTSGGRSATIGGKALVVVAQGTVTIVGTTSSNSSRSIVLELLDGIAKDKHAQWF